MAFIPLVVSGAVAAGALAGPAVRKLKSMWYSSVDLWTEDLLAKAAKGKITDRVHERESDLSWLVGKINEGQGVALLVGPPGVGKSALMEEVVLRVLEGRYPTLNKDNTHILSLDLKAMIATGGFLDFMENFVFGSGDESLQILVGDILKQSKKGGEGKEGDKYVLFIDEVQELLDKRPAAFDRLKAELARRGVVIVAATTDTLKVREWLSTKEGQRGMERRVDIRCLGAMSPEMAAKALLPFAVQFGREHRIAIAEETLLCVAEIAHVERAGFAPAKTRRLLDNVLSYAVNEQIEQINRTSLIAILEGLHPGTKSKMESLLDTAEKRREFRNSLGMKYFPLLEKPTVSLPQIEDMGEQIAALRRSHPHQIIFQVDQESVIREAFAFSEEPVFRCSVGELTEAFRRHPEEIGLLKQVLSEIRNQNGLLVIEGAEDLLMHLFPQKAHESAVTHLSRAVESGPLSALTRPLSQVTGLVQEFSRSWDSPQNPAPVESPVIDALRHYIEHTGAHALIARPHHEEILRRAESLRVAVHRFENLSVREFTDWLSQKYPEIPKREIIELIEGSVRLCSFLDAKISPYDFAQRVLAEHAAKRSIERVLSQMPLRNSLSLRSLSISSSRRPSLASSSGALPEAPSRQAEWVEAIFAVAGGKLSKKQISQTLATPLPEQGGVLQIGAQGESENGLQQVFPELFREIRSPFLWIQAQSDAQREWMVQLLLGSLGPNTIYFKGDAIHSASPRIQRHYMEMCLHELRQRQQPTLLIERTVLDQPYVQNRLLPLIQNKQIRVICFTATPSPASAKAAVKGSDSLEDLVVDAGVKLLKGELSTLGGAPAEPKSIWTSIESTTFVSEQLTLKQFSAWMTSVLPASWSDEQKRQAALFYHELYSRAEKPFSLDEIKGLMPPAEGEPGDDLAAILEANCGPQAGMTKREIQYLIDPTQLSRLERLSHKTSRIASTVFRVAMGPIRWTGRLISNWGANILAISIGGFLTNLVRRLVFRG